MDKIIVRYGEIALKGKNRIDFEKQLVRNIHDCLKYHNHEFAKIERKRGRIFINTKSVSTHLSRVFGITSYSPATCIRFDMEKIKHIVNKQLKNKKFESFRVSCKRSDKSVQTKTSKVNIVIGQHIVDTFKKKVSLKTQDVNVGIEVMDGNACVFVDHFKGLNGLPYGINGTALADIKDEDSIVAAWLMMKRGIRIVPLKALGMLEKFSYGCRTKHVSRPQNLVVSDTLDSIKDWKFEGFVLRPLIGLTPDQIKLKYMTIFDLANI